MADRSTLPVPAALSLISDRRKIGDVILAQSAYPGALVDEARTLAVHGSAEIVVLVQRGGAFVVVPEPPSSLTDADHGTLLPGRIGVRSSIAKPSPSS